MSTDQVNRQVVRVSTYCWSDSRGGVHIRKSLLPLRRQSEGFQILDEDVSMIGAEIALQSIINLNECEDGVYEVIVCNEQRDWETNTVEEYDLKLVPFEKTLPESPDNG